MGLENWYLWAIGSYLFDCHNPLRGEGMFSAMLFTVSIVALSQFGLYYWRAVLAEVAAQPVSDRVLAAAQVEDGRLTPQHFLTLAELHDLTPDLQPHRGGLTLVRLYYRAIEGLETLFGKQLPAVAAWSERERVICARYAAVQVDRRLQANLDLVASLRSC
jgi:hypothetical protein